MMTVLWKRGRIVAVLALMLTAGAAAQDMVTDRLDLVTAVSGSVLIRLAGSEQDVWRPLLPDTPVTSDDLFDAYDGRIEIQCANAEIRIIEGQTPVTSTCERTGSIIVNGPMKGSDDNRGPALIFPRGKLMAAPSLMRWRAVADAVSYRVEFSWGTGENVVNESNDVRGSAFSERDGVIEWALTLDLPENQPIQIRIDAFNLSNSQPVNKDGWRWQSANDDLESSLEIVPPAFSQSVLDDWPRVRRYSHEEYWADAITHLETQVIDEQASAVWFLELGNLYRQLGVDDLAEGAYQQAIERAQREGNQIVLHETYRRLVNFAESRAMRWCYADAAETYYMSMSVTLLEEQMRDAKRVLGEQGIQAPADCASLLSTP